MRIVPFLRSCSPALALLAGLAAITPAASAATAPAAPPALVPHLVLPRSPLPANDDFTWSVRVRVVNPTDRGIFLDSLGLDITDLDPGSRRMGTTRLFESTSITTIIKVVSPNDSAQATYSAPAYTEHGRVTMRLHYHTNDGAPLTTPDASLEMSPSSVSLRYPPKFLETKGGRVEYAYVPEVWPSRPSPAILLIPGEDDQARDWMPMAWNLANHGFAMMLMSLPGRGYTAGRPDFAGPRSLELAGLLLDRLRRTPNVDSSRVAVWGVSEGATVAALLAARRKDLDGVVLQSAIYDLEGAEQTTRSQELKRALAQDAGPRSGWKSRSPLALRAVPAAPTLLLHGEADPVIPARQAEAYAALFPRRASLRLFEGGGHLLPIVAVRDSVIRFLGARVPAPESRHKGRTPRTTR